MCRQRKKRSSAGSVEPSDLSLASRFCSGQEVGTGLEAAVAGSDQAPRGDNYEGERRGNMMLGLRQCAHTLGE